MSAQLKGLATTGWIATTIAAFLLATLLLGSFFGAPLPHNFSPLLPILLGGFGLLLGTTASGLEALLQQQTETAALLRPIAEALGRATHDKPHS